MFNSFNFFIFLFQEFLVNVRAQEWKEWLGLPSAISCITDKKKERKRKQLRVIVIIIIMFMKF